MDLMTRRVATFRVGELLLALDLAAVSEVLAPVPMTPVPQAAHAIRGLINLRGDLVTAVDLRRRFGMPESADLSAAHHVVVDVRGEWISLMVDSIGDVFDLPTDTYEATPSTVDPAVGQLSLGTFPKDAEFIIHLDIEAAADLRVGDGARTATGA